MNPDPSDPVFDRPIFIISPPRSGSTLLFERLARAPHLFTIGGESHLLIETIAPFSPAARGWDSNRLGADDAVGEAGDLLRRRFHSALRDRRGAPPPPGRVRMLEKTPKNALRIPFFAALFPEARFVYLHRDPRQTLASMMEAWEIGRFRTYPALPGWSGPPWSLLLVPGWRDLAGRPLPEIVARQWAATTGILLNDLAAIPDERVHAVSYEALTSRPGEVLPALADALGLEWDERPDAALAPSASTMSRPAPDKWRAREAEIAPVLPLVEGEAARGETLLSARGVS